MNPCKIHPVYVTCLTGKRPFQYHLKRIAAVEGIREALTPARPTIFESEVANPVFSEPEAVDVESTELPEQVGVDIAEAADELTDMAEVVQVRTNKVATKNGKSEPKKKASSEQTAKGLVNTLDKEIDNLLESLFKKLAEDKQARSMVTQLATKYTAKEELKERQMNSVLDELRGQVQSSL